MKSLVTGDRGYICVVLTPILKEKDYGIVDYDSWYYSENILDELDNDYEIIAKDIRVVSKEDLEDIDGVIHLAWLSNDPLGEFSPRFTEDIN